jgi:hypothetical protein
MVVQNDVAFEDGTRQTTLVQDALKIAIDPARGPAVEISAHDGLISADAIGWRAHFGPATPIEVIAAAALAARVLETRAQIVASIRKRERVGA